MPNTDRGSTGKKNVNTTNERKHIIITNTAKSIHSCSTKPKFLK